jgi:hypothetical protein
MTNVEARMTKSSFALIGHWDLVLGHFFAFKYFCGQLIRAYP